MRKPHPHVTALWCPIPDDDTAYEVRGRYTVCGTEVEVSWPEILIGDTWQEPRNAVLDEILRKVLQPVADEIAAAERREMREMIQALREDRWDDERKERQLERARQRMAAE